jgi:hypothetical protein
MSQRKNSSLFARFQIGSALLVVGLIVAALMGGPTVAFGQPTTVTPTTTPTPAPGLTVSAQNGPPGASITANGTGFQPGEAVDVTFNGQPVGTPTVNTGGTFSLSFTVPNVQPGKYGVLAKGQTSAATATTDFTVNQGTASLSFSVPQAAPGTSVTVTAAGFQAGETVQVLLGETAVGSSTADTRGGASVTFVVPSVAAGPYEIRAMGQASGAAASETFTVLASPTPVPTPAPTPAPGPIAPPIVHDDRYFGETGYRIDSDDVWGFFQQYGRTSAFGFPVSRTITFLGCPVQMFQRHIIQVCPGAGTALINLLDPEIFPYTQVNGSTFPAPDATMKANTPPVGSPTYADDINKFVQDNVPDVFNGAQVNFQHTFNTLGGLTIWGAPISKPQPEPTNPNFVYQRFQRGIMHFIAPSSTQSILLADYLKAIIINQNVPADLLRQARETRFFNQYCPGEAGWLCRPNDLPGTDLTFAFVNG